mgnify:CR=1 FL=1
MAKLHRPHPLPLPTRAQFLAKLWRQAGIGSIVIVGSLLIGILGYRIVEGFEWIDAVLEASMILSGMGPVLPPKTVPGKIFASCYAMFSGVVFVSVAALVLAPAMHRFLQRFHLENVEAEGPRAD